MTRLSIRNARSPRVWGELHVVDACRQLVQHPRPYRPPAVRLVSVLNTSVVWFSMIRVRAICLSCPFFPHPGTVSCATSEERRPKPMKSIRDGVRKRGQRRVVVHIRVRVPRGVVQAQAVAELVVDDQRAGLRFVIVVVVRLTHEGVPRDQPAEGGMRIERPQDAA